MRQQEAFEAFLHGVAVVGEMVGKELGLVVNVPVFAEALQDAHIAVDAQMRPLVGDGVLHHRAVEADHIEIDLLLFEIVEHFLIEHPRVIAVEDGLAALSDDEDKAVLVVVVPCGKRDDGVIARPDGLKCLQKLERVTVLDLADGDAVRPVIHLFDGLVAVDGDERFADVVRKRETAHGGVLRGEVVEVRVCDKDIFDCVHAQTVLHGMDEGIGGIVDEEVLVDHRLGTGAEISSARFPGCFAISAAAVHGGKPFRRGCP